MTETLKNVIVNALTGEVIEQSFTKEEIAYSKTLQTEHEADQAILKAKADARKSALAKLAKLGLTEEEVAAL